MKHIRMPKAIAEKWLSALRSGNYAQCQRKMTDGVGYCCLGVLQMEVDGRVFKSPQAELPDYSWLKQKRIEFFTDLGARGQCPFNHFTGEYFTDLNDTGMGFKEIAGLLEEEIEYNDAD